MIFKYVLALSLLSSSFSTDVDPETCEEADCALSLRQLRGQQYEARVWEHQGEGEEVAGGLHQGRERQRRRQVNGMKLITFLHQTSPESIIDFWEG